MPYTVVLLLKELFPEILQKGVAFDFRGSRIKRVVRNETETGVNAMTINNLEELQATLRSCQEFLEKLRNKDSDRSECPCYHENIKDQCLLCQAENNIEEAWNNVWEHNWNAKKEADRKWEAEEDDRKESAKRWGHHYERRDRTLCED